MKLTTVFDTLAVVDTGSNDITVSIISGAVALGVAYITNVAAQKYKEKKAKAEPKDRVELLFERYESALKQKDEDNDELRALLKDVQGQLKAAEKKLNSSYYENSRLKSELDNLKAQYHTAAKLDQVDRDNVRAGLDEADKRNRQ